MLKFLLHLLIVFLVSFSIWLSPQLPASATHPGSHPLLSLEDLPSFFTPASEAEVSGCRMAGEVSGFVFKQASHLMELVCVASFPLGTGAETPEQIEMVHQVFDAILADPQAFVAQANAVEVQGIEVLESLAGIGEVATGFSKTEVGIGRTEIILFRRGDLFNSVLVRYPAGQEPIVPLQAIARKVDRRAIEMTNFS